MCMTYYGELKNLAIKTKVIASMFFLLLIVSEIAFFSIKVSGAEYRAGEIRKWNWARYHYFFHLQQRNYSSPEEYYLVRDEPWEGYVKLNITNVFYPVDVSFSITTYDKDGETAGPPKNYSGSVLTGDGVEFYIIAGSLNEGDPITNKEDAPRILKTVTRPFANASRVANQAEFNKTTNPSGFSTDIIAFQIAWDRRTGLVCDMTVLHTLSTLSQSANYYGIEDWLFTEIKMLETDLWSPERGGGMDWSGPAVGLTIFSLLAVTVFFVRRRKRYAVRNRIRHRQRFDSSTHLVAFRGIWLFGREMFEVQAKE